MIEHAADGRLLMEANFRSDRFVTYRSFKFEFTGTPLDEAPALKSSVFGVSADTSTTVAYVSWNGATEVAAWRLYSSDTMSQGSLDIRPKTAFETMFQIHG